ncbi:MAG: hypothetical protein IIB95_05550 [Candidatus Marinimicrobia bacterium]|nr:hypothetical protein [Candidatus Neomarinimicrobiota bacterium]
MANKIKQEPDVLSPEEQLLKEQIEGLLEKVDPGHGEPLQVELAGRLDKTVTEFHEEVAAMIEDLKTGSDERRSKLKELWEHRNDEQPLEEKTEPMEEASAELTSWEERLESKKAAEKTNSKKKEEKPKKKGFFKHNK